MYNIYMSNRYDRIIAIPALQDNYVWSLEKGKQTILIDPGEAEPVIKYLKDNDLVCLAILITHHHLDHIGGVDELFNFDNKIKIYGPRKLPLSSPILPLQPQISFDRFVFDVFNIPGHTLDHVAFYDGENAFVGDTLFSAGCGRILEGSYEQMLASIDLINQLPSQTNIYCAHEYTLNNLKFAKLVEPNNHMIDEHTNHIQSKSISLPTTLNLERQINPFLRLDQNTVKQTLLDHNPLLGHQRFDIFKALREWKDQF